MTDREVGTGPNRPPKKFLRRMAQRHHEVFGPETISTVSGSDELIRDRLLPALKEATLTERYPQGFSFYREANISVSPWQYRKGFVFVDQEASHEDTGLSFLLELSEVEQLSDAELEARWPIIFDQVNQAYRKLNNCDIPYFDGSDEPAEYTISSFETTSYTFVLGQSPARSVRYGYFVDDEEEEFTIQNSGGMGEKRKLTATDPAEILAIAAMEAQYRSHLYESNVDTLYEIMRITGFLPPPRLR